MNIIINAEILADNTIEEAIRSSVEFCVELAERNHCSVRTEISDFPMLISHGDNFNVQDCVDFLMNLYQKKIKKSRNWESLQGNKKEKNKNECTRSKRIG